MSSSSFSLEWAYGPKAKVVDADGYSDGRPDDDNETEEEKKEEG